MVGSDFSNDKRRKKDVEFVGAHLFAIIDVSVPAAFRG